MKEDGCCLHIAVDGVRVRIGALCLILESKETFRASEMGLDIVGTQTMVGDDEESDLFSSGNQLLLDFIPARVKVYSRRNSRSL